MENGNYDRDRLSALSEASVPSTDARRGARQSQMSGNGTALVPHGYGVGFPRELDDRFDTNNDDMMTSIQSAIRMVLNRKWLILAIVTVFLALGAFYTMLQTPQYTAVTRIQIERQAQQIVSSESTDQVDNSGSDFLNTQIELLKSRALADRVVSITRLAEDMGFLIPENTSVTGLLGSKSSVQDVAEFSTIRRSGIARTRVRQNLTIVPVRRSRLVDLYYTDSDPARAADISNAYATAYVTSNLDRRFEANSYAKTFLEDQISQTKENLESAEQKLLEFAQKEQIVQVGKDDSEAQSNLSVANTALGQLVSERIKAEQLWKEASGGRGLNVQQILDNTLIAELRTDRSKLARKYQELSEQFKPGYPEMVRTKRQMSQLDREINSELQNVRSSIEGAYKNALRQEQQMKERIKALQDNALNFQGRRIQYNILQRDVETIRESYVGLLKRLKEVEVASGVGTNNIFVVDKALAPSRPSSPNLSRALLLSLMLGLVVGVGSATFLELLDNQVRTPEAVAAITGMSPIGVIPVAATDVDIEQQISGKGSAMAEAYRSLATSIQLSNLQQMPRSIAITSSGPSEGKSTTSIAVARHFARTGLKVLLVDADLRKPSLHRRLNTVNEVGLSTYLSGTSAPPDVIQNTDQDNLAFLPAGPLPENSVGILATGRLETMITLANQVFDLVVVDSPPILGLADAPLIAESVETTVFVIAAGQERKGTIHHAFNRLTSLKLPIVGTVLTKFDSKSVGYQQSADYEYVYGSAAYSYAGSVEKDDKPQIADKAA